MPLGWWSELLRPAMTTVTNPISKWREILARYAPIVLAGCGAISLWLAPSIWLHERQHLAIEQVRVDLRSEIEQVRVDLRSEIQQVRADVRQISTRMDQLIHILADAP